MRLNDIRPADGARRALQGDVVHILILIGSTGHGQSAHRGPRLHLQ